MEKITVQKKRRIVTALCAVLFCLVSGVLLVLKGAGKEEADSPEEQVKLTLVYAYQNAQWNQGISAIAEEFEKQHPEIDLDLQVQYEDKVYEDILSKRQARGELGDIVQLKTPKRYAAVGLLSPISPDVGALVEDHSDYQGDIYGMEAIGTTNGILYNRSIFERYHLKEPENYQEFLDICERLKESGVTPIGVAGGDLWHMEFWVNHFFRTEVLTANPNWLKERQKGAVSWQEEEAISMLEHLQQLFASDYVNLGWENTRDANLAYAMAKEEIAMIYTGSWTCREVQKMNPDLSLGWFYLPDEEGKTIIPQNADVYWALTKECGEDEEKYQAALCFLKFFYDSENYGALCNDICGFPVTVEKKIYHEDAMQLEMKEKFQWESEHSAIYIGNEDTPQGFEKSMLYEMQALMRQESPVSEVATRLDELWDLYGEQER